MKKSIALKPSLTLGLDVGDRWIYVARVDGAGEPAGDERVSCSRAAVRRYFEKLERCRVVLEVGTHSRWLERLLRELGHEVFVANAGRLHSLRASRHKTDRRDARELAELGHLGARYLHPIQHRPEQMQEHLCLLHARDVLVRARTMLVNQVRGSLKACGLKPPKCSTEAFPRRLAENAITNSTAEALTGTIEQLSAKIKAFDRRIEEIAVGYPAVALVRQVKGVGALTALAFVLVLFDQKRFRRSRDVAPYLGLVPAKYQSGDSDPKLGITKTGNRFLRRLLVQSAQYILGPRRPDCELRRYGQRLVERGGKAAKKRAVVAVARKLAVLMHHLWVSAEVYQPLRGTPAPN
jgi:transposase